MEKRTYRPRTKQDLRIRKTRVNLYHTLFRLLEKKSFRSINITDICKEAKINRSTFYDHFKDKYELLEALVKESTIDLKKMLQSTPKKDDIKSNFMEHLEVLLSSVKENKEIYSTLISLDKTSLVYSTLLDTFKEEMLSSKKLSLSKQMSILFYSSGSIGVIVEALRNKDTFNKEKVLKQIKKFISILDKEK